MYQDIKNILIILPKEMIKLVERFKSNVIYIDFKPLLPITKCRLYDYCCLYCDTVVVVQIIIQYGTDSTVIIMVANTGGSVP